MKQKVLALAVKAAVLSSAMTFPAMAQQEQQANNKAVEKISVTGSRIKRDSFSMSTPLMNIDQAAIEDTGMVSLSEILVDNMPGINPTLSNTTTQSSVSATGLSTVDLRDLGTNRTLTLIDGRRVVSNSYSGNQVSLNTIPSGMVKTVEVITGGTSAIYGSDAIAGVVNIITKKDDVGFVFKTRAGETTEGGGKELTFDTSFGTTFNNEKGYLYFSSTYDREFGLKYEDRSRAAIEAAWDYDQDLGCNVMQTEQGDQCMRDITQADWRHRNDGIPGGVFDEKSSSKPNSGFWYDGQTLRDDWHEERFGINTRQFVQLKVPNDNLSAALKLDYVFDDDLEGYFQTQFNRQKTINYKSPENDYEGARVLALDPETGEFTKQIVPGRIPYDNPFVPDEIRAQASSKGIKWDRTFGEVGPIITDNTRTTLRSWAGLRGTVFDNSWDWDVSVGYGQFKQKQLRPNELDIFKVQHALNAEQLDDGTIQCKDASARAEGCVPLNLFGEGSITPEMADWIRVNPELTPKVEQFSAVAYMTGDLFELPAGPVSAAFGTEYRRDSQEVVTSADLRRGGITWNSVPEYKGSIGVKEVFAEFNAPLLSNAPMAERLSADLSIRVGDYDIKNVGVISSYKAGIQWEPVSGYSLRANIATSQRAPNMDELLSPPMGDYDSFDDICKGVTADSTEPGHNNCRLEPSIAAVIAAEGTFDEDTTNYAPDAGNPELKEETADTLTIGVTLAPEFLQDFHLAVDYYDIKVDDVITAFPATNIIKNCYGPNATWGDSNPFCNSITRGEEGAIIEVMQRSYNLDKLATSGYDVSAQYKFDLASLGRLDFKLDFTHKINHTITAEGADGKPEETELAGFGSSKDKASASLTWRNDGWRVRWSSSYHGEFLRSRTQQVKYDQYIENNNKACAAGDSNCVANPEPLAFQNYGSYIKHNLSVSYKTEIADNLEARFFGGVNNVFDDKGDFMLYGRGNFSSSNGSSFGRFIYAGAEVRF